MICICIQCVFEGKSSKHLHNSQSLWMLIGSSTIFIREKEDCSFGVLLISAVKMQNFYTKCVKVGRSVTKHKNVMTGVSAERCSIWC